MMFLGRKFLAVIENDVYIEDVGCKISASSEGPHPPRRPNSTHREIREHVGDLCQVCPQALVESIGPSKI